MSFGLGRGRRLDVAPGVVGIEREELGPLPDDILTHPDAGWVDLAPLFADDALPLEIEIGPGKGAFLIQQGERQPGTNFLGIEWAREFFSYAADRVRRRQLRNVRLLCTDATEFLRWRVPTHAARVLHLYFSDPWPKAKHHKNRVLQDSFLADAWRVLEPGGELRIVTDHDDYWAWMEEHFDRWTGPAGWPPLREHLKRHASIVRALDALEGGASGAGPFERHPFQPPESADAGELVGTNFERKYRREGRPFHACTLRRVGPGLPAE